MNMTVDCGSPASPGVCLLDTPLFDDSNFEYEVFVVPSETVAMLGRAGVTQAPTEPHEDIIDTVDHVDVVARSLPKGGLYDPPEQQPLIGVASPSRAVGQVVHTMLTFVGKSKEEVDAAIDKYRRVVKVGKGEKAEWHRRYPVIYERWAERAAELLPDVEQLLKPPAMYGSVLVHEPHIYNEDAHAKAAATRLNELVLAERENNEGVIGPVERALRASPKLTLYGSPEGSFKEALKELPKDLRKEVKRLISDARTHHLTKNGDMVICPTSRPDIVDIQYRLDRPGARNAAHVLQAVLEAGVGFNLDVQAKRKIVYDRLNEDGTLTREETDASTALYWAADAICHGDLMCRVIDAKTQPHVHSGKSDSKWDKLDGVWYDDYHAGDMNKIFSDKNLASWDPRLSEIYHHWRPYEIDVAATTYSLLSLLEYGAHDYRARNHGSTGARISWSALKRGVSGAVLLIDFNINNPGEGLSPEEQGVGDTAHTLKYVHNPPLVTTGVPSKPTVALKSISYRRFHRDIEQRGNEARRQYCQYKHKRKLGKAALASQRSGGLRLAA
ncbi:MAG TPA: hypothetical protein VMB52_04235 [Verrucomicrobiae bacterium]|nr:hypothetical protein [Verrucomicrobiae bacterium]